MKLPPNTKPDSYWANKKKLANEQEIYDWSVHDFNNFNSYNLEQYKAWLRSVKQFFADDFFMGLSGATIVKGLDGYIGQIDMFLNAFSNVKIEVMDFFVKGNYVGANYILSGKNTGEFMGNPPSGKEFSIRALDIFRFENGQLKEGYSMQDTMVFLQQLGLI